MAPRSKLIAVGIVVAVLVLLVIGIFVWPTVYRYDRMQAGEDGVYIMVPIRTNRFTGQSEIFYHGWQPVGGRRDD